MKISVTGKCGAKGVENAFNCSFTEVESVELTITDKSGEVVHCWRYPSPYDTASLDNGALSVRALRLLTENKISTLGQLSRQRRSQLKDIPGFGQKCLNEVEELLHDHNLSLID